METKLSDVIVLLKKTIDNKKQLYQRFQDIPIDEHDSIVSEYLKMNIEELELIYQDLCKVTKDN